MAACNIVPAQRRTGTPPHHQVARLSSAPGTWCNLQRAEMPQAAGSYPFTVLCKRQGLCRVATFAVSIITTRGVHNSCRHPYLHSARNAPTSRRKPGCQSSCVRRIISRSGLGSLDMVAQLVYTLTHIGRKKASSAAAHVRAPLRFKSVRCDMQYLTCARSRGRRHGRGCGRQPAESASRRCSTGFPASSAGTWTSSGKLGILSRFRNCNLRVRLVVPVTGWNIVNGLLDCSGHCKPYLHSIHSIPAARVTVAAEATISSCAPCHHTGTTAGAAAGHRWTRRTVQQPPRLQSAHQV